MIVNMGPITSTGDVQLIYSLFKDELLSTHPEAKLVLRLHGSHDSILLQDTKKPTYLGIDTIKSIAGIDRSNLEFILRYKPESQISTHTEITIMRDLFGKVISQFQILEPKADQVFAIQQVFKEVNSIIVELNKQKFIKLHQSCLSGNLPDYIDNPVVSGLALNLLNYQPVHNQKISLTDILFTIASRVNLPISIIFSNDLLQSINETEILNLIKQHPTVSIINGEFSYKSPKTFTIDMARPIIESVKLYLNQE